jgi:hypothetical protein
MRSCQMNKVIRSVGGGSIVTKVIRFVPASHFIMQGETFVGIIQESFRGVVDSLIITHIIDSSLFFIDYILTNDMDTAYSGHHQ